MSADLKKICKLCWVYSFIKLEINIISKEVSIHSSIQTLCIELYRVFRGQSQTIFIDLFERKNINYNLRSQPDFVIPHIKTVYKGSNSIRHFRPIIWSLMPKEIKNCETLASFISKIRQWRPHVCPCRKCKNFIPNVRFVATN